MPTPEEHREQAGANVELHEKLLLEEAHLDWALVAIAYAALHHIDSYLDPHHPPDHHDRERSMSLHAPLRKIWPLYRVLMERSEDARYECYDPTLGEAQTYRAEYYEHIKAEIGPLLEGDGAV